ncbi:MAG: DUF5915 domain-containing protein, partial [Pirellulales bacterium]|nr:DUF5915 domain-containing protein [Pirellulales bacterium]
VHGEKVPESVHLCDYPTAEPQAVDQTLSEQMNLVREITSLGRQARSSAELKVRQPLAKVEVILADMTHGAWLESHAALIAEELNVKAVEFATDAQDYIDYAIVPNFKRLGPKLGKNMPKVKKLLGEVDGGKMLAELKSAGNVALDLGGGESIELDEEDIEVRLQAKPGWAAAQGRNVVVVLASELTEELITEGLARDLVRVIQDQRKELGCEFTDKIEIGIVTESSALRTAVDAFRDYIMNETLADQLSLEGTNGAEPKTVKIGEHETRVFVRVL